MRDHAADEVFAVPGRRNRAARVARVCAGTDDGRIAHASPALAGHAAGRRGRRDVAVVVERYGADRAESDEVVFLLGGPGQQAMQLRLSHRRTEILVGDQFHTLEAREFLRAGAHQHDVR